ncbi:hypothetical protein Tco_0053351 [Tanacetum coccineum]
MLIRSHKALKSVQIPKIYGQCKCGLEDMLEFVFILCKRRKKEKRIAEEQAAKERYWQITIVMMMMTLDYTIAITPSGYQQKDRKPSQNDKTEHGMEKDCAKSRPKSKNAKVRVNTEEISSHTEAGTEEYYWKQSNPFDGRESPIVISMKM